MDAAVTPKFSYHVESDVLSQMSGGSLTGVAVPAVVRRTASGDTDAVITTPDATPEEVCLIAAVLLGVQHGRVIAHQSVVDEHGGFTYWVFDDQPEFGDMEYGQ